MADNTMGSDDPSVTMGVNLAFTNIEQSSAQLDALISQTEDWRTSIEAVKTSLSDTYDILSNLSEATGNYRDVFQEVLDLSERHESVLRRSVDNAQALAAASRDMQGMLGVGAGLGEVAPLLSGEVGGGSAMAAAYGGVSSPGYGGIVPLEVGGIPGVTPFGKSRLGQTLSTAAEAEFWLNNGMTGGGPAPIHSGSPQYDIGPDGSLDPFSEAFFNQADVRVQDMIRDRRNARQRAYRLQGGGLSERQKLINKTMNIPYYLPGGRLAALARYVNTLTMNPETGIGMVTGFLQNRKFLYGREVPKDPIEFQEELRAAQTLRVEEEKHLFTQKLSALDPNFSGTLTDDQIRNIEQAVGRKTASELGVSATTLVGGLLGSNGRISRLARRIFGGGITKLTGTQQLIVDQIESKTQEIIDSGVTSSEDTARTMARSQLNAIHGADTVDEALRLNAANAVAKGMSKVGKFFIGGALLGSAGLIAYKSTSKLVQGAREYAGATGDANAFSGYWNTSLESLGSSIFSLGLMDYKTASEIRMGAERAGFRRGGSYYDSFVRGASDLYSTYGIDPNEYMQLFQDTVVNAKISMQELTGSIATLGRVAAHSNTSFEGLRKTYDYYLQSLYKSGATGTTANALAMGAASYWINDPQMQGKGSPTDLLSTRTGQIMASMAAGLNPMDYYNTMSTSAGRMRMTLGTDSAIISYLWNWGLTPGMDNMDVAIKRALYMGLLDRMNELIPNPDGTPWEERTALKFLHRLLSGKGGSADALARTAINKLKELGGSGTHGPTSDLTGKVGLQNFFSNLSYSYEKEKGTGAEFAHVVLGAFGVNAASTMLFRDPKLHGGKTLTLDEVNSLSLKEQAQLRMDLIHHKAFVAETKNDIWGNSSRNRIGKWRTLDKATGVGFLTDSGSQSALSVDIKLHPDVKKYLDMVFNSSSGANMTVRDQSRSGANSNTAQNSDFGNNGFNYRVR